MPHFTSNFCVFCYKGSSLTAQSVESSNRIELFYKLLGRFSGDSGLNKLVVTTKKLLGASLKCCIKCEEIIHQFCETYHKFKCLELELDRILDDFGSKVELANRIPTRWADLNKLLDEAFVNDKVKKAMSQKALRKIRQNVVKAGHLRSMKSTPRIKLDSRKVNSTHRSRTGPSREIATQDDKIKFERHTEESAATTMEISIDPSIVTKIEVEPDHLCENGWQDDEQGIPELQSSIFIGEVFQKFPMKTENVPCYLPEVITDSSPQIECYDPTLTSAAIFEPQQRYSLREDRVACFSTENDNENICDSTSDNEDISSNYDDNTDDDCKTRRSGKLTKQCKECKKWFKNRLTLHTHQTKYHSESVNCPVCEKSYPGMDDLNRHILNFHKNVNMPLHMQGIETSK